MSLASIESFNHITFCNVITRLISSLLFCLPMGLYARIHFLVEQQASDRAEKKVKKTPNPKWHHPPKKTSPQVCPTFACPATATQIQSVTTNQPRKRLLCPASQKVTVIFFWFFALYALWFLKDIGFNQS